MKGKREEKEADKPVVETESYRIWDAKGLSQKEQETLKEICLGIYPGERIHEVVVFNITMVWELKKSVIRLIEMEART
jgi:hypothetical protein